MPLAVKLNHEEFGRGTFLLIFSYLCVLSPLWIAWGWRWITSKAIPVFLYVLFIGITFLLTCYFEDELAFLPALCFLALVAIDSLLGGQLQKPIVKSYQVIKVNKWFLVSAIIVAFVTYSGYKIHKDYQEQKFFQEQVKEEEAIVAAIKDQMSEKIKEELSFQGYESNIQTISLLNIVESYKAMTDLQRIKYLNDIKNKTITLEGDILSVSPTNFQNVSKVTISIYSRNTVAEFYLKESDAININNQDVIEAIGTLDILEVSTYSYLFKLSKVKIVKHTSNKN